MNTYKLGNKVSCVIRSFSAGRIGDIEMQYENQPYTVLEDLEASLHFSDYNKEGKSTTKDLNFTIDNLNSISLSNVKLTDKILNLIFSKYDEPLAHYVKNLVSDSQGKIYLPTMNSCQIFIYNDKGLVAAFGCLENSNCIEDARIEPNCSYLVCYSTLAKKGFMLNRSDNIYLTLDLQIAGNTNNDLATYCLHLHKCALSVDKNLYFSNDVNTVDLKFKILHSDRSRDGDCDYMSII